MADKIYKILIAHPIIEQAANMREILKTETDRNYEVQISSTEKETLMSIIEFEPILVVIRYDEQKLSTSKMIKALNNLPVSKRPGILTFGSMIDMKVMRQLSLLGSLDYMNEPMSSITLRIKVKNAIGSIEYNRDKDQSKNKKTDNQNQGLSAQEINNIKESRKKIDKEIQKNQPIKIDIEKVEERTRQFSNMKWEIDQEQCKSTKGNWVFLADGPAPDMGKWEKENTNKWNWKWDEKIVNNTQEELPNYSFEGIEPMWTKGNWENGKWVMGGKSPSLNLFTKDKSTPTNIINFENNKPEISVKIEAMLPPSLLNDLSKTFLIDGEAKLLSILRNCHYSNEKIAKLIPYIKEHASQIQFDEEETEENENILPTGKWIHIGKSPKTSSDLWFFEIENKNYNKYGFYWHEGEQPVEISEETEHVDKARKAPNTVLKFLVDNNIVQGGTYELQDQYKISIPKKNAPSELDDIFGTQDNANTIEGKGIEIPQETLSRSIIFDKSNTPKQSLEKNENSFSASLQEIISESTIEHQTEFKKEEIIVKKEKTKKSIYDCVISGELKPAPEEINKKKFVFEDKITIALTDKLDKNINSEWNSSFSANIDDSKKNNIDTDFNYNLFNISLEKVSIELKKLGGIDLLDNNSQSLSQDIDDIKKEEAKKKKIDTQRKSEARLNIFTQAITDLSRKAPNIYITAIDLLHDIKEIDVISSNDILTNKELGHEYNELMDLFSEKKNVIYLENSSETKTNRFLYPFFTPEKKTLIGIVVFRKGAKTETFSMTEKITCSAIANSVKYAFNFKV